jgi:hypothetical protein
LEAVASFQIIFFNFLCPLNSNLLLIFK